MNRLVNRLVSGRGRGEVKGEVKVKVKVKVEVGQSFSQYLTHDTVSWAVLTRISRSAVRTELTATTAIVGIWQLY